MKISPFDHTDYKAYLQDVVSNADRGSISKLAEAAGCQRSYLSRCLSGEVHLTKDHAFHLSEFLKLSDTEAEYFMNLVEKDRASTHAYRQKILKTLKSLKTAHEDLHKISERPRVSLGEKEIIYYSSWLPTALHIIVSIPSLQSLKAIAERLQVDPVIVEGYLRQLQEMNLVRKEGSKWIFNSGEMHVPKDSPLVHLHHNNWRQRAVLDSQKASDESIHYTVVQSIDAQAQAEIRNKVLKMIKDFNQIAGPSKPEELVCFTCDFFKA